MLLKRIFASDRATLLVVAALLFLPQLFSAGGDHRPRVFAGDEPHYLVILNSLLAGGDLDLRDDYAAVHRGGLQAGRLSRGSALAHHSVWTVGGQLVQWWNLYEVAAPAWQHDAEGHPVPTLRTGASDTPDHPEYSSHPAALAFYVLPFAAVARAALGADAVESTALLCVFAMTVAAMLLFRWLLGALTRDRFVANLVTSVVFLATPLWHYSRVLFCEGPLALCAVGAYAFAIRRDRGLASGCFLACGMLMKPPFALLALPLLAAFLRRRHVRAAAELIAAPAVAAAVFLFLDDRMFGGPFVTSQSFIAADPFVGALGLLASPAHGLALVAPVALLALVAWPRFWREQPPARVLAQGVCLYFVVMATFHTWNGGWCYGPRYIVPILPLALAPLVLWAEPLTRGGRRARLTIAALCVASVGINAVAAVASWSSFGRHPIVAVLGWLAHRP